MYHEHPLKIIKIAAKNIWLLIFPLLRGIKTMHLDFDVFYNWIMGAWFDILVILIILGYGFIKWTCTWIRLDENEITLISGIFVKSETNIPYKNISSVSAEHTFFLRPFKAVKIKINTRAGAFSKADMKLLMKRNDYRRLYRKIPVLRNKRGKTVKIQPKLFNIIFFSFVFSSSLSGAIYISALFFQFGTISRDLLENELKTALGQLTNEVSSKFAVSIPPAAIILGILIIATWLLSFIANIFRYAGFSMKKGENALKIKMGAVTRRSYHIVNNKINYVDIRQSIIMKIFRKISININCSGYGIHKNELPVLLPILENSKTRRALKLLDLGWKRHKNSVNANKKAVITFIGMPLIFCLGIPAISFVLIHFFPSFCRLVISFSIMAEIPSVWMLIVKITALLTTSISIDENFICIKYSRSFSFHTILADRKKLVKIQIMQNPIQKKLKRCRLDFYFTSELPVKNKVYGINLCDAEKILKLL